MATASTQSRWDQLWNGVDGAEPVALLGPSGVAKTATLTAMVDAVNGIAGPSPIGIAPGEGHLAARFQSKRDEIEQSLKQPRFANGAGTDIADRVQEYPLKLMHRGKVKVTLRFHDYAGALLAETADRDDQAAVQKVLDEAAILIIPIDATALMEEDERGQSWHALVNKSHLVYDHLARILQQSTTTMLVLLVPVKSETYLHHLVPGRDGGALVAAVKSAYAQHLNLLEQYQSRVAAAIVPVATIGEVRFDRIEDGVFYHAADWENGRKGRYRPHDADQLARYMLAFATQQALDANAAARASVWGVGRLTRWALSHRDDTWREALRGFTAGIKTGTPFVVVQRPDLIGLR